MPQTRIAFVDMPRMLREIVKDAITRQTDMTCLGEFPAVTRLVDAVEATGAEFVITDATTAAHEQIPLLLKLKPRVRVLGITDNGRQTYLYELRPQRVCLGEVSPQTLVEAIRGPRQAAAT